MIKIKHNQLGLDLIDQDFSGQNGEGALFRGANLSGCSFVGTNLKYANMRECNIEGADFTGANLIGSNFKDCTGTAIFVDAKIKFAPKWIDFIGADDVTEPDSLEERQILIDALLEQGSITMSDLNRADTLVVQLFIQDGTKGDLNGGYGDMPTGRGLYNLTDVTPFQSIGFMITECIRQESHFNISTNEFV